MCISLEILTSHEILHILVEAGQNSRSPPDQFSKPQDRSSAPLLPLPHLLRHTVDGYRHTSQCDMTILIILAIAALPPPSLPQPSFHLLLDQQPYSKLSLHLIQLLYSRDVWAYGRHLTRLWSNRSYFDALKLINGADSFHNSTPHLSPFFSTCSMHNWSCSCQQLSNSIIIFVISISPLKLSLLRIRIDHPLISVSR